MTILIDLFAVSMIVYFIITDGKKQNKGVDE